MKKHISHVVIIGWIWSVVLGLHGCSNADELLGITEVIKEAEHLAGTDLVLANTEFAFDLLAKIHQQQPNENIFISPFSISLALSMTLNGAEGKTQLAMANTLKLDLISLDEANQTYAKLRKSLQVLDTKVELSIANSLWLRQGVTFKPDFLERNQNFFGTKVAALDFDQPQSVGIINRWVSQNTNKNIPKIIDSISPQMVMLIINAIHFKGRWSKEFDKSKTREKDFQLLGEGTKRVPMMHQSGKYLYYSGSNFQVINLPYGSGRIGMYIFLPNSDTFLGDFLTNLNADNWKGWISKLHKLEGDVALPRLKFTYEASLNRVLKVLGMEVAFAPNIANFGGMRPVPPNLFITEVKHKSFVEVNEEGAEAAAATSVEIGVTSIPQKFSLMVNRPFLFVIQDNWTQTLLFMGAVFEPVIEG